MKIFLSFISIFAFIIGTACHNKTETARIEVIEGITHIHNPVTPLHPQKTISFEEELTIGGEEQISKAHLSQPTNLVVDEDENIYVSDWSDQDIKVFDKEGNYIRTIGAKGSGPGEFQRIGSITLLPDRKLVVMDFDARRTSIFDPDGQFLNSYQWQTPLFFILLATDSSYTTTENSYEQERQLFVKTFDFSGNELVSFGEFKPEQMEMVKLGEFWISIPKPFAPHSIFVGDPKNQWLYHCYNSNYLIELYDETGKLFRKIDRPYKPVPFTNEDKQKYLERKRSVPNSRFEEIFKKITFPDYKTISKNFLVDDQNHLWVRTFEVKQENDKSYVAYDIFNQDGFYEARVWIDLFPRLFLKGKMYTIETDKETDLQMVKRYRVLW